MAETDTPDVAEETPAAAPAAEFYSDAHRDSYLRALAAEKRGYDQKADGAEENGGNDDQGVAAATWTRRAAKVQDEINRVTGDVKKGKPTARGRRKPTDHTEAE